MSRRWVIEEFRVPGGLHCETTALRSVLVNRGHRVSEELLLGMGGGLGFVYWYATMMPAPFVGGRFGSKEENFIAAACRRVGVTAHLAETSSATKGYALLRDALRRGDPAIAYGDMAYLPYFAVPETAHFGGHVFAVYGIDEDSDTALIADRARRPLTVSLGDLAKARGSTHPPFPPRHRLITVEPVDALSMRDEAFLSAIGDSCRAMLDPPIRNLGLAGIKTWADRVIEWPSQFRRLALLGCLMNTFMYIEIGGTGGSAFRPMYARFLREAHHALRRSELTEAAGLFDEAAAMWTEIAHAALPDAVPSLARLRGLLVEKNRLFEEEGQAARDRMWAITREADAIMAGFREDEIPLADILAEMRARILALAAQEERAFQTLARVVGA